jgi:hypothetical protein
VTLYEQAIGSIATLVFVSGFICALILYSRAGRGIRVLVVALSWVVAIVLYRVIFFALPEDSGFGYVAFVGLAFVFLFAFWGVIDLAIHSNARLKGGEAARFAQGAGLLALSAALFVATYFVPDALASLIPGAGFGVYFLGILGAALAAILCFRAGARAVYANRAAVPGLLSARKATAEVVPEKAAYLLGETVHATVRISGRRDFEVSDARAELLYTSRYSYLTFDPRGGSLLVDETDREVVDTERLQTGVTISKGKMAEHRVSLRLPTEAPPTGEGEITGVAWAVGVVLDVPGGPDVVSKAPIRVLSTRETCGGRSDREPERDASRDVEIKLRLASRDFRPGERVEGRLVVTPREAFEAKEVKVELVRRELVLRDDGNHHETVEARETVAGRARFHPRTSQGYAFGVVVPRDLSCPSSETARTYVGWFLRGVIDRGLRQSHTVEQELNVFGGPRRGQSA